MSSDADRKRRDLNLRLDIILDEFVKGVEVIRAGINHPLNEENLDSASTAVGTLEELNKTIFKGADLVMTMLMERAMNELG